MKRLQIFQTGLLLILSTLSFQPRGQAVLADGLILHYDFDVNEGLKVTDQSGRGNTGFVQNGATHVASGKIGGAYKFDGINDKINGANLGYQPQGTIAFWMQPFVVEDFRNPFSVEPNWDDNIRFETNSSGTLTMGALGLGTIVPFPTGVYEETYTTALEKNIWNHVIYSWDATEDFGYLDGVLIFNTPHPDDSAPVHPSIGGLPSDWRKRSLTFSNITIGNGYSAIPERSWKGLIDDVRIYDRVLSPEEALTLAKSGSTAVPEPSTMILTGLGLAFAGFRKKFKK